MEFREILASLVSGKTLSETDAAGVFEALLRGQLDDSQMGALLALLQTRIPSVDELTGAARAMRAHFTPIPTSISPEQILDTCGTGGAAKTFNVSTAAAIVAAATGLVHVAKHGNRSRTGRGSAEVLAALGVNIDAGPVQQARCLEEAGVCFCFALHHHPAMKYAATSRRALGIPTIFNLLGPLTNPAGARRQLIGVYRPDYVDLVAATLARLSCTRALVVHGAPGLDELSISGTTTFAELLQGTIRTGTITPADIGLARAELDAVSPTTLEKAASMLMSVLSGEKSAARDMVILSTAGALVAGADCSLPDGAAHAAKAIDSGQALGTLKRLIELSGQPV